MALDLLYNADNETIFKYQKNHKKDHKIANNKNDNSKIEGGGV